MDGNNKFAGARSRAQRVHASDERFRFGVAAQRGGDPDHVLGGAPGRAVILSRAEWSLG
jgi:hypothetical protein